MSARDLGVSRAANGWRPEPPAPVERPVPALPPEVASAYSGPVTERPPAAGDPDLASIRRMLEERRDRARARVAVLAARPELGSAQGFGKRIGDGTTEAVSRLTEIGVGESLERGLARTERALAKLDDGTYGTCDSCGEPIARARLQAIPDGVLCLACAASEGRGPARRRR